MFLIFVLTLAGGLCCAWFIYSVLCQCWCPEEPTACVPPEDGDRIQFPKLCEF
jgi:hypothetical protein